MLNRKIKYNIHNEFHMLRHFENVEQGTIDFLLSNGFSIHEIETEIQAAGSRFFPQFSNRLNTLIEILNHFPSQELLSINGNLILTSTFEKKDYPNGIGTEAVISLDLLTEDERNLISHKKNRDFSLAHLKVARLPSTHSATMILKPIADGYHFITAYPGHPSQPIPAKNMDKEMYRICEEFWSRMVFLEKIDS